MLFLLLTPQKGVYAQSNNLRYWYLRSISLLETVCCFLTFSRAECWKERNFFFLWTIFFHRKVDIFSILLSASTKWIWLTRTTSFPSGFHLGSYFILPLKTKWSCLRSFIVCALLLAFQILSIGALFRACDYLRLKHTNKTHLIVSGPDSGQSMGCQNSCSSGKPAAQGLFRERSPSVVRWFLCSTVWLPISPLKEGRIHHH